MVSGTVCNGEKYFKKVTSGNVYYCVLEIIGVRTKSHVII